MKVPSSSFRSRKRPAAPRGVWKQTKLEFPNSWGGKRDGAGRKRTGARRNVAHRVRPGHFGGNPVHVTLRSAFRPLRSQHVFPTLGIAIREATRRNPEAFRILHFSVQWDHVHLVVEASDGRALSSGVAGVAIRLARAVNELLMRRGRFWADRWHGRELASPRQVRNALVYVLGNFRKHANARLGAGVRRVFVRDALRRVARARRRARGSVAARGAAVSRSDGAVRERIESENVARDGGMASCGAHSFRRGAVQGVGARPRASQ